MIDKADLRIPMMASFQPGFRLLPDGIQFGNQIVPFGKSRHYIATADLRRFGIDALLHLNYRHGHRHDHKCELLATGRKSLQQLARIATTVFDVDPFELALMRIDFTADLKDVPVSHMHRILRVRFKRCTDEHGIVEYETIGKRVIQYFRYGNSPNCFRVYDKPAECKARFAEMKKHASRDADELEFEKVFGFPEDSMLTRVERQAGGGRLPREIQRFKDLERAADFNPFAAVEIIPDSFVVPDPKTYGVVTAAKFTGIHTWIQEYGLQRTRAMMNAEGNASRYLNEYFDYMNSCRATVSLDGERIYEVYRESVRKQIDGTSSALTDTYPVRSIAFP